MVQRMIVAVVKVKKIFLITKFWIVDLDSCCSSLKCLSQDMFVISGMKLIMLSMINFGRLIRNYNISTLKQNRCNKLSFKHITLSQNFKKLVQLNNRLECTKEVVDKEGIITTDSTLLDSQYDIYIRIPS